MVSKPPIDLLKCTHKALCISFPFSAVLCGVIMGKQGQWKNVLHFVVKAQRFTVTLICSRSNYHNMDQ